jgi:DNA-binding LacI/PurR family transcriptional regulator
MLKIDKNASSPFFEQVKDLLRTQIVSGRFKADGMIPDERSLAAELRISRMTVRRAIVELTQEGLLKRVRGKGTYVRGAFAPQRTRQNTSVALIAPFEWMMPNSLWYYRMLHAIYEGAEREGMTLSFRTATLPYDSFVAALRRDTSLKGLIVLGIDDTTFVRSLKNVSVPTVLLDTVQTQPRIFDEINHASEESVTTAVRSLLHLGHRDIALLSGENPGVFQLEREAGYRKAFASYGLAVRDELIVRVNLCEVATYAAVRKLLHTPHPPTAMFCIMDEVAHAAVLAVKDHGWQVPRDVSIIGFGDLGTFMMPALSTIRVPIEKMGVLAIETLARRFNDPTAPLQRVLLESEFAPRGSCDCPRDVQVVAGARSGT